MREDDEDESNIRQRCSNNENAMAMATMQREV